MCHKPEKLSFDLFDFDDRQFLTMTDGFVITFAAFHLESQFLVTALVRDDVGNDARTRKQSAHPPSVCRR